MRWQSEYCAVTSLPRVLLHVQGLMIIIPWNVRGVGNIFKRHCVKEVLNDLHADWIGIQETKLNMVDSSIIAQFVGWPDVGFTFSLSIDSAGCLLCCWN